MMNLTTSTALNIEHEVERFAVLLPLQLVNFYTK